MTVTDEDRLAEWRREHLANEVKEMIAETDRSRLQGFDQALLITYATLNAAEKSAAEAAPAEFRAEMKMKARATTLLYLIGMFEDHRESAFGARSKWDAERKQQQEGP